MNESLYHLVREPKVKKDKNPLLLLLHGYGSNEEDLFSFAPELPEEYYVISARAPYALPPYGHAWYSINFDADENKFSNNDEARVSRDRIIAFLDELAATLPIDPDDVTLIGFSQGCILSYAVALSRPDKIRRVVAMSGYLNPELPVEGFEKKDFSNLKMFVSHGSADQVVPVEWARKAPAILEKLGIEYEYKEYPVGHGVAPQNFYDLLAWLRK
jgi:phospholipase/carboxylesterase